MIQIPLQHPEIAVSELLKTPLESRMKSSKASMPVVPLGDFAG